MAFEKALITSSPDDSGYVGVLSVNLDTLYIFPLHSSSALTAQTANDTDMTFLGQWSLQSVTNNSGLNGSFYQSNKTGDRVEVTFKGESILNRGCY